MATQSPRTDGERLWRGALYALSAVMAASALVDFDAGQLAKGLGALGAAVLMLSLMVQFPFLRAVLRASREEQSASPERVRKQREDLMQQADKMRATHPWAEVASRAGWTLLAISLVLRVTGLA